MRRDERRTVILHLLKTLAVGCLFNAGVSAADWNSADGIISVTVPDESRFVEVDCMPPASVIWVSIDETIKLGVAEVPCAPNMRLIQASVERGLAEELGGEIVASSIERQAGHEIYVMTGHGEVFGTEVYLTQAVVAVGDKVYKAMATGLRKDTRVDSDVTKFMSSFKILTTKPTVTSGLQRSAPLSQSPQSDSDKPVADLLSQKIGGISAIILIICAIAVLISRSGKNRERDKSA